MEPIYVTRPSLPPLDEFTLLLEEIWDSRILTNGGPFHQQLEQALCTYLGVEHLSLFANGTIAMVTALKALGITGEVITTPYSFVATSHSLLWNNLTPVFVDIDPVTLNIDPALIEAAITPQNTAILPVHCYGNPCDVEAIQRIADQHGLKVIYDAAHAFGVRMELGNLFHHGDVSVLSFHATKVFNTFEGGAIISRDAQMKARVDQLKNFGFTGETTVVETGINGKMNEIQAALGLLQLKRIDACIEQRAVVDARYRNAFKGISGLACLPHHGLWKSNYSYFPLLVGDGFPVHRDSLYEALRAEGIYARRYFYPLITDFPMYRSLPSARTGLLPVAERAAGQILCLPIYESLHAADQERVIDIILNFTQLE